MKEYKLITCIKQISFAFFFFLLGSVFVEGKVQPNTKHALKDLELSYIPDNRLKKGLDNLASGNIEEARSLHDAIPAHIFDKYILTWAIAVYGAHKVPAEEIIKAAKLLKDWPGAQDSLFYNGERALSTENPSFEKILSIFSDRSPHTTEGAILLARALKNLNYPNQDIRKVLSPIWRKQKLTPFLEKTILHEFATILTTLDHQIRMENMLYHERIASAQRLQPYVNAQELFKAWVAVLRNDPNAEVLINNVPAAQRSPAYLFIQAKLLRKKKFFLKSANIILKAPKENDLLLNPDVWWIEKRALSRELLDLGEINLAYKVIIQHSLKNSLHASDAEFHAGWYALRGLKDPIRAEKHFLRFLTFCKWQVSKAKAFYWLGRTAEFRHQTKIAKDYFLQSSLYSTTFYGQLSAAKLGKKKLNLNPPKITEQEKQNFFHTQKIPLKAIKRLETLGFQHYAAHIYQNLAKKISSPQEIALLIAMAEKHNNHFLVLQIAKIATRNNIPIGRLAYPKGAISPFANTSKQHTALMYAIAKQETEFRTSIVSQAGAQGMLQITSNTAKEAAKKIGIEFSDHRLKNDTAYNIKLAEFILEKRLKSFDGSYLLTIASYNAGAGRIRKWMKHYGDPRRKDIHFIVDWIERLPYAETRYYIHRVTESYQVYKSYFLDHFDIIHDLKASRDPIQK